MGTLEDQLHTDMVAAMKARDRELTVTLRMAIGALKNEKVAGKQARQLSEADEVGVLQREVKSRLDSAQVYAAGGRPELAAKELTEVEVISSYLPAMLTECELDVIIAEEVAAASDCGKPSMRQLGAIIKAVNARVAGRSEGKTVALKVKSALA